MSTLACAASLCDAAHGEFPLDPAEHGYHGVSHESFLIDSIVQIVKRSIISGVYVWLSTDQSRGSMHKEGKGNKWARFEVDLTAT